ncbi:MAG: hypothetical protein JWP29_5494 [Rhodoferax sp.]|nr:hypothetical protein [Rhodoferax sp.]
MGLERAAASVFAVPEFCGLELEVGRSVELGLGLSAASATVEPELGQSSLAAHLQLAYVVVSGRT